jgi:hypothetical protein
MKKCLLALLVAVSVGCGSGGGSVSAPSVPVQTFNAAVSATGNGFLEVHPSILTTWCCSLLTPIRVTETGGGKADWVFARLSLFKNGREIERAERGSDYLSTPPDWTKIEPHSATSFPLFFRLNSTDFDDARITLGFNDRVTARSFTVDVPFSSFSGVRINVTPLSREAVAFKE